MNDFKTLLFRAGFYNFGKLDRKGAMKFLFVTERTLERWCSGAKPCPRAVAMLESRICGGITHKDFEGFRICREGKLWTPSGHAYPAHYLNKLHILQSSVRFAQSESAALKAEIDKLKLIVEQRERIGELGKELIEISEKLHFADLLDHYIDNQGKESA